MSTLYLRMPADDDSDDIGDDGISAILDDDSTTFWTAVQPMTPGQYVIIDRGDTKGDGQYESMIDGDPATKWSTTLDITPGQAVIIDRGDPLKGIGDPDSMLDADAATFWSSGINMAPGMTVIIDRGATNLHLFNQIIMNSGTANVHGYARGYTISVSWDKTTWTQVSSGAVDDITGAAILATDIFDERLEQYVKITQTGTAGYPWVLASVRLLYVKNSVGTDLHVYDTWSVSISGITATLPAFNTLVMNSGVGSNNYARSFTVAVSNDKTVWTTVATGSGATPLIAIGFDGQRAQYVRIMQASAAATVWTLTDIDLREDTDSLDRSAWDIDVDGNVGPLPTFDQIVMDSGSTNSNGYARRFDVYVSTTGTLWSKVTTGVGASAIIASARFDPQTTRYFKVVQTATAPEYWALASLTALSVGTVLDRSSWEASASVPDPLHPTDYWLPISVNGQGPIPPDPMNTMNDTISAWYTTNYPVMPGHPLIIDRGTDTTAFNNIVVYFGAPLTGQLGTNPADNNNPATRFQILVSPDKVTWTWTATAYASKQVLVVLLDPPQTAQYIQIALMDGLIQPWTVTSISLFDGDTPLSRTGWTVTTAEVRPNGGIDRSLLRLDVPGGVWVDHLPPTATPARPLRLKMPDKSWKTVMSLGSRTFINTPGISSVTRRITINDLTGVRNDILEPVGFNSDLTAVAINYSEWRRALVDGRPTGDQAPYIREHDYWLSTIWVTQMDEVRQYWSGFPVQKLRFGFQIQNYGWDVFHPDDHPKTPSPETFLLYREPSLPPQGVPPTSVTGTPIYTFSPVHDWPAGSLSSVVPPEFHRGEMFWYEIDPVWDDLAFTLCTMWQVIGLEPPITDPGTGANPLPDLADGFYDYRTLEAVYVNVVFQVVLDES